MRFVRFEILLPLRYNDGSPVELLKYEETREELVAEFGALSEEVGTVRGTWVHENVRYQDELIRFYVECAYTRHNQEFFKQYSVRLKERFQQLEIRITSHSVRVY